MPQFVGKAVGLERVGTQFGLGMSQNWGRRQLAVLACLLDQNR